MDEDDARGLVTDMEDHDERVASYLQSHAAQHPVVQHLKRNQRYWIAGAFLFLVVIIVILSGSPVHLLEAAAVEKYDVRVLQEVAQMLSSMDRTTDPCVDFYQYACGGWINKTVLPDDKVYFPKSFGTVGDANALVLKQILEEDWPYIGTWYKNCMDMSTLDQLGASPLQPYLRLIDSLNSAPDLLDTLGKLHRAGFAGFFDFYVEPDFLNVTHNMMTIDSGGMSLPERDYYFSNSSRSAKVRTALAQHITRALALASVEGPANASGLILDIEEQLAASALPAVDRRDPINLYHKIGVHGLSGLTDPVLPWNYYFAALGSDYNTIGSELNVAETAFMTTAAKIIASVESTPQRREQIKSFLNESFVYSAEVNGAKAMPDRWSQCLASVSNGLGEILGRYFVERMFPGKSKTLAMELVSNLRDAMHESIASLTWMDDATRSYAFQKLAAITPKIGFPDEWADYSALVVKPGDYFGSLIAASELSTIETLKAVGKPVDKGQWHMESFTVNAYYNPLMNEIVFPAGIMQGTFFNHSFPPAINYGGIGMVMGHEITHGFDDQGSQFDAEGRLRDWWSPAVKEKFSEKTQCIVDQYSAYTVLGDVHLNGELTLGENIADNGGIKESFLAYKKATKDSPDDAIIQRFFNGITSDQLFFLSFAQGWCSVQSDEFLYYLVTTDPHSPSKFRVLGPLANFPAFATAFNCKSGTPMNPTEKCSVW